MDEKKFKEEIKKNVIDLIDAADKVESYKVTRDTETLVRPDGWVEHKPTGFQDIHITIYTKQKKKITYRDIITYFESQFPGLKIYDYRPTEGQYSIYVWLKETDVNLIATYHPETDTFTVKTTREKWSLIG